MSERVAALGALYQAEKTDAAYIFNTAMAMMGAGVAYLVAMVSVVQNLGGPSLSWRVALVLPFPLWLIAAFHSLITLNAMSHGVSVRIIEHALFTESGLLAETRSFVGSAAGDRIMDINQSRRAHVITTLVVYVGVALMVLGFTGYVIVRAWNNVSLGTRTAAMVGYLLLAVVVASSWIVGLLVIAEANDKSKPALRDATEPAIGWA